MKRFLLILLALAAFSLPLGAVKAWPYPVTVTQPDGSTLVIRIHGDENRSWKTTADGRPVYQDSDGWWRPTDSLPPAASSIKLLNPEGGSLAMFLSTKAQVRVRTIVIPVQFRDCRFTTPSPRAAIYNLFNQQNYSDNGATGSVLDYFRDNLGSMSNLSFDVCDVVTLPYDERYYGANTDGVTDKNIKQLVVHACEAADQAVNFSQYDFDGDGTVDNVFILFAGHNEAEGGGDATIWPQSWNIADMGLNLDGMRISNFSLYSEYSGATGYRFAGIGTICHEYCHFLGLNDLYDVNGDVEGDAGTVVGTLSIMDRGNYNNDGRTPPYLTIFERRQAGLVTQRGISQETRLTIVPVQNSSTAWTISASSSGEDFWLEYRDGTKWDAYAGGSGLVIYHVDKSNNTAGSMSAKLRWTANAVNACASHPCAAFVPSSGTAAESESDAFYPGPRDVRAVHSTVNFPLRSWNGRGAGFGVLDITRRSDGIDCRVVVDDSWDLPVLTGYSIIPGQTSALLEWESDKSSTGQWNLRWGLSSGVEAQTELIGSQNRFVFGDLIPGESYFCELWYSRWNITGKVYRMEFRALSRLSDYPLIGGLDQVWRAGDKIRLILLNMTEEGARVDWSINSEPYREELYTFDKAGSYKISAQITYSDGSKETLTKILEVKDAQ